MKKHTKEQNLFKPELKWVIKAVVWWRLALFAVAAAALKWIGYLFPYPNFRYLIELGHNVPLFWSWGGFDGVHYIIIAESGYIANYTQAFFPVFPQLISIFHRFFYINYLFSGLMVANLSLVIAMILFWKLLRLDMKRSTAMAVVLTFLLFPTAYYLGSVYTESTFLVFVFGSFLSARLKKWWLAGILGSIAAAARPIGIFLFPALLAENWSQQEAQNSKFKIQNHRRFFMNLIPIILVPLGLIAYMIYLNNHFHDPLKFIHSQPAFGADRSDKVILLYQVFWRYIKMMFTVNIRSWLYYRVFQELFWSVFFLIFGLLGIKKVRSSYSVFALLTYLTPTLTGTFSSMPRYVLVIFPVFIICGRWLSSRKKARRWWYVVSGIWLIVNMSLFLTGRWVA